MKTSIRARRTTDESTDSPTASVNEPRAATVTPTRDDPDRADALARAHDYLNLGGLFNPELANHNAVSLLIRDMRNLLLDDIVQEQIANAMVRGAESAAYSERALCVTALREIVRLRLATDEGSLRVRSDRIWEIATKALSEAGA